MFVSERTVGWAWLPRPPNPRNGPSLSCELLRSSRGGGGSGFIGWRFALLAETPKPHLAVDHELAPSAIHYTVPRIEIVGGGWVSRVSRRARRRAPREGSAAVLAPGQRSATG